MIGIHKNSRGFTLVEMMVAVSVFAVSVTVITFIFLNYLNDYRFLKSQQTLVSSGRYALDMMAKEAKEKEISSVTATTLTFSDGTTYALSDGLLSRNGEELSYGYDVDSLNFYYSENGQPWLTIDMSISHNYRLGKANSIDLQTTVSSRLYE
jgi:prepilin-type N-terminal cleavage/methylation domain-containing protein